MKTIDDLKLKAKEKAIVRTWLTGIVKHFERMSAGERETVERYDFDNLDFFYFTDCRDILSKNPESKGVEDAESIRKRKKAVEYKLIFQSLLGKKLGKKRPCSHCGNNDRFINSLGDGTGHYLFCPKCGMTTVVTYPIGYNSCMQRIINDLKKHDYDASKFLPPQIREKCKCDGKCKSKLKPDKSIIATLGKKPKPDKSMMPPIKTVNYRSKLYKCSTCGIRGGRTDFSFSLEQCNSCYYKANY